MTCGRRFKAAARDAAESGCVGSGTSPAIAPTIMACGLITGDSSETANSVVSALVDCAARASSSATSSSLASTTSAKTMVTLSGPPERKASSTSRFATSSKEPATSALSMVDAVTGSDKPAEHNKMRSPGWASSKTSVGSTSLLVYALKIKDFCGCEVTSSGSNLPSSTSDCTYVSSLVTCCNFLSRSK